MERFLTKRKVWHGFCNIIAEQLKSKRMGLGEKIETTIIRVTIFDKMRDELSKSQNMLNVYKHLKNEVTGGELVLVIDKIGDLQREVDTCTHWVEQTREFATMFYN